MVKNPRVDAGDTGLGSIPGLGGSPEIGNGNPLQHSCLENPMDDRSLAGYSPRGHKRVSHDLAAEQPQNTRIFVNQSRTPTISVANLMK